MSIAGPPAQRWRGFSTRRGSPDPPGSARNGPKSRLSPVPVFKIPPLRGLERNRAGISSVQGIPRRPHIRFDALDGVISIAVAHSVQRRRETASIGLSSREAWDTEMVELSGIAQAALIDREKRFARLAGRGR